MPFFTLEGSLSTRFIAFSHMRKEAASWARAALPICYNLRSASLHSQLTLAKSMKSADNTHLMGDEGISFSLLSWPELEWALCPLVRGEKRYLTCWD